MPPLSGRGAHPSRRRADLSKTLTAPETSGTYAYIVCVDATPGDTDTINNCSQGIPITVEAQAPILMIPPAAEPDTLQIQGPDLVIRSARVESPTVMIGGGVRLYITLTNQGTQCGTGDNDSVLPFFRRNDFRRRYRTPSREGRAAPCGQKHHNVGTPAVADGVGGVLLRCLRRYGRLRI